MDINDILASLDAHLILVQKNECLDRIDKSVHRFGLLATPTPIFSSLQEPKKFTKGFEDALDRLSFFFFVAHSSFAKLEDMTFLAELVISAIKSASTKDYVPFYQKDVFDHAVLVSQEMLAMNAAMRKREIEAALAAAEDEIANHQLLVNAIDVDAIREAEAPFIAELATLKTQMTDYTTVGTIPDDLEILAMFTGFPGDQILYNQGIIEAKILGVWADLDSNIKHLRDLRNRCNYYKKELGMQLSSIEVEDVCPEVYQDKLVADMKRFTSIAKAP